MKIYDCITFFDEKMMFDLRLNVLDKYVDKFVVVEQLYTHSGAKKKQNFNINDYKKFKDKIVYILIDKEPEGLQEISKKNTENEIIGSKRMNSLKRIEIQYNSLIGGITDADPEDLIMVSDCDEIPNLKKLEINNIKNNILLFKQKIFYYKFNLLHDNMNWFGTKACKKKKLITFDWLKYIKNKKYPIWRIDTLFSKKKYTNLKVIDNGGWHFTNVKNNKDIFYKLSNYGEHNEFERSNLTEDKIKDLIDNHQLYFNHKADKKEEGKYSAKIQLKKIHNSILPEYLNENLNNYKDWLA